MAMASARPLDRLIRSTGRLDGRALRTLVLILFVLIAVESIAAVQVATLMLRAQQTEGEREAILAAARQQVVNLTTVDYRQVDLDIQRISGGLTGKLRDDFASKQAPRLAETVRKAQTVSRGTALSAGIISRDEDSVEVVVAANSTVQSLRPDAANQAAGNSAQRLWRATLELRRQGDRWLTDRMELEVIG